RGVCGRVARNGSCGGGETGGCDPRGGRRATDRPERAKAAGVAGVHRERGRRGNRTGGAVQFAGSMAARGRRSAVCGETCRAELRAISPGDARWRARGAGCHAAKGGVAPCRSTESVVAGPAGANEAAVAVEDLTVGLDRAARAVLARAQVADHVPVEPGLVGVAGFRITSPHGRVERPTDLLIKERVTREVGDAVVSANGDLAHG